MHHHTRLLAWVGLTALLAGCTAAAGGGAGLIIGLLSALTLYACIADTPPEPEPADAGRADGALDGGAKDGGPADGALEAGPGDMDVDGGFWESCCVDGVVDTCYCPANTACNYGWYQDCGDGTCAYDQCGGLDQGPPDQGVPDQSVPDQSVPDQSVPDRGAPDEGVVDQGVEEPDGGFWEPCCVDGVIDACYCPAGAACNYGWFQDCGEGTCIVPGGDCP